jgi:hypothetical protein
MARKLVAGLWALLALGTGAQTAGAQVPLAPSLAVDTRFAPPQGIARDDLAGAATDIPSAVAVDGDRIYTVGEARDSAGDSNVGIVVRRSDGAPETGFSGDGKLVLPIAAGTGKDVGVDVIVLPDHRVRILASTDTDATPATAVDVAVIGLLPDGSLDAAFSPGGADGPGRAIFPAAAGINEDTPTRLVAGPDGRLAITGAARDAAEENAFVALLEADGTPVAGFGSDPARPGVRVLDRSGGTLNDRGVDVDFRPGGGIVAYLQVETNPDASVNDFYAVLHAFDAAGADDGRFAGTGDLVLSVGQPDTSPGGLLVRDGRLLFSGATKVGQDTDAFIARVNADGSGLESRRYDIRGTAIEATVPVVSAGSDLDVVPGVTPTLVVTGSINYNSRPYWAAAAFNNFDGPLAAAGFGEALIPTDEYGAIVGVAAGSGDWAAIAGSLVDTSANFDTSFGISRLLVDADKRCDLALEVIAPLEITMPNGQASPVTLRITNAGTRRCVGTLSVPAGYTLSGGPLTFDLGPGGVATTSGLSLSYAGPRVRDQLIEFRVSAPGDAKADNDARTVRVLFDYCDLALRAVGGGSVAPTEGYRRYELLARNRGTSPCRGVRVAVASGGKVAGGQGRFTLRPGRSATVFARAAVTPGGKAGERATLTFRGLARANVIAANDTATIQPKLVGVGDSSVTSASARAIRGGAAAGYGGTRRQTALKGVEVAVRRLGAGCRWLAGTSGRLRTTSSRGPCRERVWIRAEGGRSWRLDLRAALPPGRYVVFSRAVTGAGFREGSFSEKDRNRRKLEIT